VADRAVAYLQGMQLAFSIDPAQALSAEDEIRLVKLGAELGYEQAWTPSGADSQAFDRCLRWHEATGLTTGISVAPASGETPAFYAEQARRVWEGTGGKFLFGIGSGQMEHPAPNMRRYVRELRSLLPDGPPIHLAALGPLMLKVGAEEADGVALNWCSHDQVVWSRGLVEEAARKRERPAPLIGQYIRTAVDPDAGVARATLGAAARRYALISKAYRSHFEWKGFTDELDRLEKDETAEPSDAFLAGSGAAGAPGEVRAHFHHLAEGLDIAIVRVLVTRPGDAESARLVLEECRPE
jgi:alkanesulfonate monooxygenase SsuD/methylene tetrahydromethanopterin reductase-like flavin-dependent oxidoreductase (luciferase family)